MNKEELQAAVDAVPYWYHRIKIGEIETPGWAPINVAAYGLPERMDGERIIDLGAWDGFWTFHALNRGAAEVIAVDDFSDTLGSVHNVKREGWKSFDICAKALGYEQVVSKMELNLDKRTLVHWDADRVFCFGLLYHVRNPLFVLQNIHQALRPGGTIHVETAILDNLSSPYTGLPHDPNGCYAEFYPADEFGMNQSNWWVPTLKCAAAWLEVAGFKNIETWKLTDTPTHVSQCRGFLRANA